MTATRTLLTGLMFGESPRWHDGRLWLSNWGAREILAVDLEGRSEVMVRLPFDSIPFSIDWLTDGRLLIVSGSDQPLLSLEPDGSLSTYASSEHRWNEVVVDGRGHVFVNGAGFDVLAGAAPKPGIVALVSPDGGVRPVADGIAFPNGMAVTPDGSTLIVADSYGHDLTAFDIAGDGSLSSRRTWADVGDGVPDGICVDDDGAVWYADVPNRRCTRVREGGEVLEVIELDRGCFACMLGGDDGRTLFMLTAEWKGMAAMANSAATGQVVVARAPAAHAGRP
jgi:sugar lactone lactonase YvrE